MMNQARRWAWLVTLVTGAAAANGGAATSKWVYPGADGKLVYKQTPTGDRVMDFSHAGYMGGGVPLPTVAVRRTVPPSGGQDDTTAIQAAIDAVSVLPLESGFRGAVLLGPGTFVCSNSIVISASGVVLRGSGKEADTTLKLAGKPHPALVVLGSREKAPQAGATQKTMPRPQRKR